MKTMTPAVSGVNPDGVDAKLPVSPAQSDQDVQRLTQAAIKFEAFFVAQMMQQMRKATAALADADSALNDQVNQAPLAMADNAVADALSAQRAFGIADVLVRQMSGALHTTAATAGTPLSPRNLS